MITLAVQTPKIILFEQKLILKFFNSFWFSQSKMKMVRVTYNCSNIGIEKKTIYFFRIVSNHKLSYKSVTLLKGEVQWQQRNFIKTFNNATQCFKLFPFKILQKERKYQNDNSQVQTNLEVQKSYVHIWIVNNLVLVNFFVLQNHLQNGKDRLN